MNTALSTANTSRITTFDLARGLAILFMMLIHVLDFYGQSEVRSSLFGEIITFLGKPPAAPVFMFIMGLFIVLSSRMDVSTGLKRAAGLLLLAYVLNLFRGSIPLWLSLQMGLVTEAQLGGISPLTELLIVDILQFAALALAIGVLVKHYLSHPVYWVFMGLAVMVVSPLLWGITTGVALFDEGLKLLWGHKDQGAMFPLFPWLAYPLFGMAMGYWFKRTEATGKLFIYSALIGAVLVTIGTLITLTNVEFHYDYFLRSGPGATIWIVGFVLLWIAVCHFIVRHIPANSGFNLLYFWSRHVTSIYVIQWLIIGWGLMAFGVQQLNMVNTLLMMLGVVVLSDLLLRAYLRCRQPSESSNNPPPQGLKKAS